MKQDPQDRTGTKDILCGTSERDPLYVTEQYHGNSWTDPIWYPRTRTWNGMGQDPQDGMGLLGQDRMGSHNMGL